MLQRIVLQAPRLALLVLLCCPASSTPAYAADPAPAFAKSDKSKSFIEASRLMLEGHWKRAAIVWESLLKEFPANRNYQYLYGHCLLEVPGRRADAVPPLLKAIEGDYATSYNPTDPDAELPPVACLSDAMRARQLQGNYHDAIVLADRLLALVGTRHRLNRGAVAVKESCQFAIEAIARPSTAVLTNIMELNTELDDYAPVVTADGNELFFTSHRAVGLKGSTATIEEAVVYHSKRVAEGWGPAVELKLGLDEGDRAPVSISSDGNTLVTYASATEGGGLYVHQRMPTGWSPPEAIGAPIDSRYWETHMAETFDGQERYFVSDRPDGEGGRDLYRVVRLSNNTWSLPATLGPHINTPGEEESPVLSADGRTLYFSSNGHPGLGGFDLYRCDRLLDGSWGTVLNLGAPVNTPEDETSISIDVSGRHGYIASSTAGKGGLDLFEVEFLEEEVGDRAVFKGVIESSGTHFGQFMVEARAPGFSRTYMPRGAAGAFVMTLPTCRAYQIILHEGDYQREAVALDVPCDAGMAVCGRVLNFSSFGPKPEVVRTEISVSTYAIEQDGNRLSRQFAESEAEHVLALLREGAEVLIQLTGSASGDTDDDERLARQRAENGREVIREALDNSEFDWVGSVSFSLDWHRKGASGNALSVVLIRIN